MTILEFLRQHFPTWVRVKYPVVLDGFYRQNLLLSVHQHEHWTLVYQQKTSCECWRPIPPIREWWRSTCSRRRRALSCHSTLWPMGRQRITTASLPTELSTRSPTESFSEISFHRLLFFFPLVLKVKIRKEYIFIHFNKMLLLFLNPASLAQMWIF